MFGGLVRQSPYVSLMEWVRTLDHALTKAGAKEVERAFLEPSQAKGASSNWSAFNSATVGQLRVEVDRLHNRAATVPDLPGKIRRPLRRLTRRLEKLEQQLARRLTGRSS